MSLRPQALNVKFEPTRPTDAVVFGFVEPALCRRYRKDFQSKAPDKIIQFLLRENDELPLVSALNDLPKTTVYGWAFLEAKFLTTDASLYRQIDCLKEFKNCVIFYTNSLTTKELECLKEESKGLSCVVFYEELLFPDDIQEYFPETYLADIDSSPEVLLDRTKVTATKIPVIPESEAQEPDLVPLVDFISDRVEHRASFLDDFASHGTRLQQIQTADLEQAINEVDNIILDTNRKRNVTENAKILLLGERGAGKTTLSHYVPERHQDAYVLTADFQSVSDGIKPADDLLASLLKFAYKKLTESDKLKSSTGSSGPENEKLELIGRELLQISKNNRADSTFDDMPSDICEIVKHKVESSTKLAAIRRLGGYFNISAPAESSKEEIDECFENILFTNPSLSFCVLTLQLLEDTDESIAEFCCRKFILSFLQKIQSVSNVSTNSQKANIEREALQGLSEALQLSPNKQHDVSEIHLAAIVSSSDQIRKAFHVLVTRLSYVRTVFLVFDNIDQRPDEMVEAIVIKKVLSFVANEVDAHAKRVIVLVAMRAATMQTQNWLQTYVSSWRQVQTGPADLCEVLRNRLISFRQTTECQSGVNTLVSDLLQFINVWDQDIESRVGAEDSRHLNLIDIISYRHPFNVGKQVNEFCLCLRNPMFFSSNRQRHPGDKISRNYWYKSNSFEYYVRLFLTGRDRIVDESSGRIINLFDAGEMTRSPFNAVIRFWMLRWIEENPGRTQAEIIDALMDKGIDREILRKTIAALFHFDLIRFVDRSTSYGVDRNAPIGLSLWGRFFIERIALDLPYVSSFWWVTPMNKRFRMGTPGFVKFPDLEAIANTFLRWLHFEESNAVSLLSNTQGKQDTFDLAQTASLRVYTSLENIRKGRSHSN